MTPFGPCLHVRLERIHLAGILTRATGADIGRKPQRTEGITPDVALPGPPQNGSMTTVRGVIERHGHFAHGGNPDDAAETWSESGFEAHEVDEWLQARCFDPSAARDLADAGVTPEMARMKTSAGSEEFVDTVGFKVSTGDLEVDEARDLVGVH